MKLNKEQFEAFSMEISTFGNIPICSQYCGIGCVFCKVHTDSYLGHYPKIPFIDEEDLLKGFEFINPKVNYVRLGAGVLVAPHTDPFLHPNIYKFIKMASDYFPTKKVTTVTTGAYIDENMIDYLNGISNYGIDLSLITMQEQRESIIPRSERERTLFLLKNGPINKCTLMFTGNLEDLKRDIELLYSLGVEKKAKQILVRRIEHTAISQQRLKVLSQASIDGYERCIEWLSSNYPNIVFTVPVLKDSFRGGSNEYFTKAFKDYPNVKTNLIENHLYGGSVTVSGLLNHDDIREQFHPDRNDVMLLPEEMYNSEGRDLKGEKMEILEQYYKAKIYLT